MKIIPKFGGPCLRCKRQILLFWLIGLFPVLGGEGAVELHGKWSAYDHSMLHIGSVAVSGNYAYLVGADGLHVVDMSQSSPERVAIHQSDGVSDVAIVGSYAFVASQQGLEILDIHDPTHPLQVAKNGAFEDAGGIRVAVAGGVCALLSSIALDIYDVSDPTTPKAVGAASVPTTSVFQ